MERAKSYHRRKIEITFFGMILVLALLGVRLTKLMIGDSEYYASLAQDLHERERTIKAQRGRILDRNGVVLADNRTVCTISADSQSDQRSGAGDQGADERIEA